MGGIALVHNNDHSTDCLDDLYWGLDGINHTGQECCGVALYDGDIHHDSYEGVVRAYKPGHDLSGYCGIGNVSTETDHQPRVFKSTRLGKFALTFDGYMTNAGELREQLGELLASKYQVEVAAKLIAKGVDFPDGIENLSKNIVGPFCLGILTENGELYAGRCPMGTRPLAIGEGEEKYGILTESRGFGNMGMGLKGYVEPGDVVKIDNFGFHFIKRITGKPKKICSFLTGYHSWVDCIVDGIPVNVARERVGALMARKDEDLEIDVVTGVPDSGKAYAEGYSRERSCQYSELIIKWAYAFRSYTRPSQKQRDMEANAKLSPIPSRIRGQRIVLFDDSIRRGTQLKQRPIRFLREHGAKEVHLRIGSPRNTTYCRFDRLEVADETLLANQLQSDERIAEFLGVDSIRFPTVDEYVGAIVVDSGLSANEFCLGCYEGQDFSFTGRDL